MNKLSNPFLSDDTGLEYMPDLDTSTAAMIDSAMREEIDSGNLPVNVLDAVTWIRIASDIQRSIPT